MPDDARNQNSIMSVRLYCFVTYSEQGQDVKKNRHVFQKTANVLDLFLSIYMPTTEKPCFLVGWQAVVMVFLAGQTGIGQSFLFHDRPLRRCLSAGDSSPWPW